MTYRTDVFIAGGGPAGLAAGIAARKKGFDVVVADGANAPIEKACGEGLMPDTLDALLRLGVTLSEADGFQFSGIRFLDGPARVDACFPHGAGIGVRRTILHKKLIHSAESLGIKLLWNCPVTGINAEGAYAGDKFIRSRWIVGADGFSSLVAKWSGLDAAYRSSRRFARQRHYKVAPWSEFVEIYWGKNSQAYITPVGKTEVCVVAMCHDPHARMDRLLEEHPSLAAHLGAAEITTVEKGAVTAMHRLRRVARDNVILIGDASGGVDAITGEGLRLGFEQAFALADALLANDLHIYEQKHRQLARRPEWMGRLMLLLDGRPELRRRTMSAFSRSPELFTNLLATHVGQVSPRRLAATGALFSWKFLTA
jgi:flavin-dependent dehydrogenase